MNKETIHTDQAPAAVGPYAQAIRVGNFVYTAGQAGLNPSTGKMVEGDVAAQAEQTMQNLAAVLEAAGSNFDNIVKTTIFLRFIKDFKAVNEVYASYFEGNFPARSTVAVSALPLAALVEIEMVALVIQTELDDEKDLQDESAAGQPKEGKKSKARSMSKKANKKKKQVAKGKKKKNKK